MNAIPRWLSKTKLLRGYRCQKCIYLTVHAPQLEAPITADTQALFDQGNRVGIAAREFFPRGLLIDNLPWDFAGALAGTREAIASQIPIIYEAAFEYMGCYARADILRYSPETKRWQIYEVKATTKIKPEHLDDVGLQTWIMAKSGLPIEQVNLMHLNPDCRYPDLSNLFQIHDVTAEMREQYPSVQMKLADIFTTLRQPEPPAIDIGNYCLEPNKCGFTSHCWQEKHIPPLSIFNMPGLRDRKWELYKEGIIALDDKRLTDLNPIQQRMVDAYKTGERYINRDGIKQALAEWQFPLIFLDFETINPAIPCYEGCGPYMHTPFQFSVHRLESWNAPLTHEAFLHIDSSDPRPTLIPDLLSACGDSGSIVAYYGKFEAARIQELANFAKESANALEALIPRIVDPLPILREHVYDNAFAGSFSLKSVGPALIGDSCRYNHLPVGNGNDAQRAFAELIDNKTSSQKKQQLQDALLEYCKQDTLVMVELAKWLYTHHT